MLKPEQGIMCTSICAGVLTCLVVMVQEHTRLAEMRLSLRDRLLQSPLMNGLMAASNVEAAYREMWENFVSGSDGEQ